MQQFVTLLQPDERDCWIQQDGASSHTARSTMDTLHKLFGERIISKGLWPPRSPDLSPPDLFLWSFLKGQCVQEQTTHNGGSEEEHYCVYPGNRRVTAITCGWKHDETCGNVQYRQWTAFPTPDVNTRKLLLL
jgi:hypothetical protein